MRSIPILVLLALSSAAVYAWSRTWPITAPPEQVVAPAPPSGGEGPVDSERAREPEQATTRQQVASPSVEPSAVTPAEAEVSPEVAERQQILLQLRTGKLTASEQSHMWRRLADLGAAAEVIALLEAALAENPNDSHLHELLGNAHVTRMRSENLSPMARMAESKAAMTSFDRALELNPENWTARFSRAMSNSRAPAFLGRQKAAINDFETLLKQQKLAPFSQDHAHTYAFLGNLHEGTGNEARAKQLRAEARGLFPDDERFQ